MSRNLQDKTIRNDWLRGFSVCVLLCGQFYVCVGGCSPSPGDGGGTPTNGQSNVNANDNAAPPDGGGNANEEPEPDTVDGDVSGWWVVEMQGEGGGSTWGQANASRSSGQTYLFSIDMDDDSQPYLTADLAEDGSLRGVWMSDLSLDQLAITDPNWEGSSSGDGETITGVFSSEGGARSITMHRAAAFDYKLTGMWTRAADGAPVVAAFDGQTILLSALDADGNWPDEGRYTGIGSSEATPFSGYVGVSEFQGLLFADGERMHLLETNGETTTSVFFDRQAEQSNLNGRWVAGWRKWEGRDVWRGIRCIVASQDTIYMHAMEDGIDAPLTRTIRAVWDGAAQQYVDASNNWAGWLHPDESRIIGERPDTPGWYESMDKTMQPAAEQLTGEWTSVSIDWVHHDDTGDILRFLGSAELSFDGDILRITDSYEGGTTYEVQAEWTGDHFEGNWWDSAAPDATSPWSGELLAGGIYLHGSWVNGEYSFSALPIVGEDEIADSDAVFIADPYQDNALMVQDEERGVALSMFREQGVLTGMTCVTPDGPIEVVVDDRMRPAQAVGLGETMTLVWSDDASTVEVTITGGGGPSTAIIAVDLSDEGILAAFDRMEADFDLDMHDLRDWLADNPGLVQAVARGEHILSGGGTSRSVTLRGNGRLPLFVDDLNEAANATAVFAGMMGAVYFGMAAVGVTAAVLAPLALIGAAAALVVIAIIATTIIWGAWRGSELCCYPCGLACWINCCSPNERPDD